MKNHIQIKDGFQKFFLGISVLNNTGILIILIIYVMLKPSEFNSSVAIFISLLWVFSLITTAMFFILKKKIQKESLFQLNRERG